MIQGESASDGEIVLELVKIGPLNVEAGAVRGENLGNSALSEGRVCICF